MAKETDEILAGINQPVAADATSVSIKDSTPIPGEKFKESSRFDAMEKAGVLQAAAVMASALFGKKVKKQGGVNVFSGFDGASGAQTGLRKAGVPINKYYASEIDKDAINFTQHNYPETIQLGDIRDIDVSKLGPIDYGFFGFPCQSLSSANHNGNIGLRDMTTGQVLATLDDYEAAKAAGHELSSSTLFYEALKQAMALQKINPDVRLSFENVASMKPEFRKIIDDNLKTHLDLDPSFEMNTKGPTNRKRRLWTNAITVDDYNALSERMKQVMPEDIIDQNAPHTLSAKGAKDNQTDLFVDKGGEVVPDGKFEPKTNARLKGKLNTATASNGAGKLMKNGLEYDMTKKEMNRSQGNPDNLGLDYEISDRQFAKIIGNGWDQFQFKPIFDRAAMEAKGNIPKPEGRLGDENALKAANATYLGDIPNAQFGTRFYHSQGSPIEAYGDEIGIPKGKTAHTGNELEDWKSIDKVYDILSTTRVGRPGVDQVLAKIEKARSSNLTPGQFRNLLTAADYRVLEELATGKQFNNFRKGIWNANSPARLNTYGPFNYRIDLPARDVADRAKRNQLVIRDSFGNDIVTNTFEPVPRKYISPGQAETDPLLYGAKRYDVMKQYGVDNKTAAQLIELNDYLINRPDGVLPKDVPNYLSRPNFNEVMGDLRTPRAPFVPKAMEYLDTKMAGPNAFDRNQIRLMRGADYSFANRWFPKTVSQTAASYFESPNNWGYYSQLLDDPRLMKLMPAIDDYLSTLSTARFSPHSKYAALFSDEAEAVRTQLPKTVEAMKQPLLEEARKHNDTNLSVFRNYGTRQDLEEVILGSMLNGSLPRVPLGVAMSIAASLDGPVVSTLRPHLQQVALQHPRQVGIPETVAQSIIDLGGYGSIQHFADYLSELKYPDRFFVRNQVAPILKEMALERWPERVDDIRISIDGALK